MGETRSAAPTAHADRFGCSHCDAVYIDTNRILDSCRDKDCFENVRVYLSDIGQEIIDRATSVRAKCAEIVDTCISVSPMNFNRGFYQINVRMYIRMEFETCVGGKAQCVVQCILCFLRKAIAHCLDTSHACLMKVAR